MKNSSTSLTKLTLQKFKRNSWGVFSFIFLCACVCLALFAYVLAPDDSKNANQMHLSIHSKSPGFKVKMLKIPYAEEEQNSFSEFFIGKKNNRTPHDSTAPCGPLSTLRATPDRADR